MSNISASPADFNFWEFVCCGRCQLPFSDGNSTVPFWLTDCGHVTCNNHLNVDQSCAQCGSQGIQLVPLQQEMDAPISDWFHSIPMALDTVAFAAKFQQETMGSQIRYYRSRNQQQRGLIERMKRDIAEVKKVNENLSEENAQLRQHLQHPRQLGRGYDHQSPSSVPNTHGKRQMIEEPSYGQHQGRPKTNSSPLSALGPNRLTLPQGHQPPQLSSNRHDPGRGPIPHMDHPHLENQRPTSGFIEQYAHVPPSTPQYIPQHLSHTQAAPRQFQRSKANQEVALGQSAPQTQQHRSMPPPPTPVRFKPAEMAQNLSKRPSQMPMASNQIQTQSHPNRHRQQRSQNMGPSLTPAHTREQQSQNPQATQGLNTGPVSHPNRQSTKTLPSSSRFVPPAQRFVPPSTATQPQRLQPPTPSIGGPQRFMPPGSRASSRAVSLSVGSGQRAPFVPGSQGPGFM